MRRVLILLFGPAIPRVVVCRWFSVLISFDCGERQPLVCCAVHFQRLESLVALIWDL